jgi:hypothetical protein
MAQRHLQQVYNQLCAGINTLHVTDVNNCAFDTIFNFPIQPIVPNLTKTNVLCHGDCNGTAQVNPTGGHIPYTYNWQPGNPPGDGTNAVTGLCAGNYAVTITDLSTDATPRSPSPITQPQPIVPHATHVNATCAGVCDGIGHGSAYRRKRQLRLQLGTSAGWWRHERNGHRAVCGHVHGNDHGQCQRLRHRGGHHHHCAAADRGGAHGNGAQLPRRLQRLDRACHHGRNGRLHVRMDTGLGGNGSFHIESLCRALFGHGFQRRLRHRDQLQLDGA